MMASTHNTTFHLPSENSIDMDDARFTGAQGSRPTPSHHARHRRTHVHQLAGTLDPCIHLPRHQGLDVRTDVDLPVADANSLKPVFLHCLYKIV